MKKSVTILMVIVFAVVAVGCSTNQAAPVSTSSSPQTTLSSVSSTAVATEATSAQASATKSTTENPLAGKAVKPDGTPYLLGYIANETTSGWMSASTGYEKSLWERAGGKFVCFVSDQDVNKELSMMTDLEQMKPDAILIHPTDSAAIAPAVKAARDAGYPVFNIDMGVVGAETNSYVHIDQTQLGKADADYVIKNFSEQKPAVILEMAGGLAQDAAQLRMKGFHDEIATASYCKITQTIDTDWSSDKAYTGIQDAFQKDPTINVVYVHSDMMDPGVVEGLRALGRLVPAGQPGHVTVISIDGDPTALKNINDGNMDAAAENNPVLHDAVVTNVILACLYGQTYGKEYPLPVTLITKDNANSQDRWAALPVGEYDSWPVLNQNVFPIPSR